MPTRFHFSTLFKSLCVTTVFALSATAAHAGNADFCFEDGLKPPVVTPPPAIHVDHRPGHGWGHAEHNWHFDSKHHGWSGWGGHSGSGNGGNGGIGVSPIPEPQTDAMLLAGLVMVGALVRRKAKTATKIMLKTSAA